MPSEIVLITGATLHRGFTILVKLLQNGYRARIANPRPEQVDKFKRQKSIKPFVESIEFVQVPDITSPNAYDEAIKGVSGVLHVAETLSRDFPPDVRDWQKLLYDPAEKSVLNMLAVAHGEASVKRVVVMSDIQSSSNDLRSLPHMEAMKNYSSSDLAYASSVLLPHLAGTRFMEERKPHFDLIRILPGYEHGASEPHTSVKGLRDFTNIGSNEGVRGTAIGRVTDEQHLTLQVLLDDVAKAHVLALKPEHGKNGDNLLVVGNGGNSIPWAEFADVIERLYPEVVRRRILSPRAEDPEIIANFDVSSTERALGFQFVGAEEMVRSVVGYYLELLGFT